MARLRLTADCGSCSFSGYYYYLSHTLHGQLRSTIIEAGRTLPRRYSNAVSRLDGPRLKATALLFPALAGVVPISYAAASMMALVFPRCHRYMQHWIAVIVITAACAAPALVNSSGETRFYGSTLPA